MDIWLTRAIFAALLAFAASVILCPMMIPFLTKLKFGQNVRSDGPKSHLAKTGTPTMGGIVILLSITLGAGLFLIDNKDGLMCLFVTLAYGFIGFIDDYIKVVRKRSLGLRAYQKFIAQVFITAVFSYYLYNMEGFQTTIYIFFTKSMYFDLGVLYIPFIFFVMLGTVNGVNFTDGLDGLASGVTLLVVLFFLFLSYALGFEGLLPLSGAAAGALLGFLLFNAHPARVFMGDTGSLALGGFVAAVAIITKMEMLILIVGFVYLIEVMSVALQVSYFKISGGKRIFKMAPIHHHFEQSGWPETRVVALFYVMTAVCCLVGFLATQGLFA